MFERGEKRKILAKKKFFEKTNKHKHINHWESGIVYSSFSLALKNKQRIGAQQKKTKAKNRIAHNKTKGN